MIPISSLSLLSFLSNIISPDLSRVSHHLSPSPSLYLFPSSSTPDYLFHHLIVSSLVISTFSFSRPKLQSGFRIITLNPQNHGYLRCVSITVSAMFLLYSAMLLLCSAKFLLCFICALLIIPTTALPHSSCS